MRFLLALSRAIDDHPVRARLAAGALLVLAALAAGFPIFQQFMQPRLAPARPVPASIGMSIEPLDPRTIAQGGEQGLFFEITEGSGNDAVPLVQVLKEGKAVEVWEILRHTPGESRPTRFYANFAYQAPGDAPDCVVKEWGISAKAVSPPKRGVALQYTAPVESGAAGVFAVLKVLPNEEFNPRVPDKKFVPVAKWSDGGQGVTRIGPGKTLRVLFALGMSDAAAAPAAKPDAALRASELRAYARVSIGGKDLVIESSNAFYAVWLDEAGIVSVGDGVEDPVENLRSLAYLPRGALTKPSAATQAAPAPADESKAAASPGPRYVVQLGAFRQEAHARQLATRLTAAGLPCAVTRIAAADGSAMFRVRLTPALQRGDAELLRRKLEQRVPGLQPNVMREDR